MKNKNLDVLVRILIFVSVGVVFTAAFFPEYVMAQLTAGGLEGQMKGLTQKIITVILPLASVLGLVYGVFLALSGDASARGRIITVIICSIVGFMSPEIIRWFQSAAGY